MGTTELSDLLERAAPTPTAPLDIHELGRRARRRRSRRRTVACAASVVVIASLTGLAVEHSNPGSHDMVVAGPASSRKIAIELHGDEASTDLRLLDGTQLRLTVPQVLGHELAAMTFADLQVHGSVYAGPARGWRIDVSSGSVTTLVPGGEPLVLPPSSRASAAVVDRTTGRLGLQYGSWALVASGDSMTDADIIALATGIALLDTPDGFVEDRGSLALWTADSPDVALSSREAGVSVFLGDHCPLTAPSRRTAQGLDAYRIEDGASAGGRVELCDRANHLRVGLHSPRSLTDDELDTVRLQVLSVGRTLAAVQRGEHP